MASVFIDAWRGAYRGIVDDAIIDALQHGDIASWMRNLVANTAARTFVAEESPGEVLGFTRFGDDAQDPANGHIFALYVATECEWEGRGSTAP